ncbi:hypothetical protein [Fibrobacter sp.]|uniref:hypothetical protein n=1 Tax=Fibrobacter sp. TaxID=35828 RepID=UPI00261F68EB|nr:hypothetical protein [Fibrobacter sp.]MDD5942843.1 hypothetical protein [Fibrobacter sp.]
MRKILVLFLFLSIPSFALSLNQVRADLKRNPISGDSIEMSVRTSVSTVSSKQSVSVFFVQKGKNKIYSEINTSFLNQRSIVNGSRMKIIDLNTNKFQIIPYNGEPLDVVSYTNFNPLASGEWGEPKFVSENLYSIKGDKGTLYYNSKKKRIEKMETEEKDKFVLTEFSYDVENNLKTMSVHVSAQGVETTIVTEILKLRHSRDFPDKLFEF